MSFRELLKLYKEGTLDEAARREIEEAIDREDAILEYLSERDEILLLDADEDLPDAEDRRLRQTEERFRAELTRRIRRAFVRLGICVGAVLLAVLLLLQFVLPRLVDRFYYDPGKTVATEQNGSAEYSTNRMSLDMSVYSELFLPCAVRDNVSVIGHGYGEYDIVIIQNLSRNGRFTDVGGRISKGHLILYDNNTLKRPVSNSFEWGINMPDPALRLSRQIRQPETQPDGSMAYYAVGMAGYPDDAREWLDSLADGTLYQGFISLDAVMDYDSFYAFLQAHDLDGDTVWCAVQLAEKPAYAVNIGFDTFPGGSIICYDREKYPALKYDELSESGEYNVCHITTESAARAHLNSLLRYMGDQNQFRDMLELDTFYQDDIESMIDYLDSHGVWVYGFSLTADKQTLLELQDSPEVYSVAAQPVI